MIKALLGFPKFAFQTTAGIGVAILTDIDTFLIVVLGILLVIAFSPAIGIAVAASLYVTARIGANWVTGLAREINFLSRVMRDNLGKLS